MIPHGPIGPELGIRRTLSNSDRHATRQGRTEREKSASGLGNLIRTTSVNHLKCVYLEKVNGATQFLPLVNTKR